MTVLYAWSPFNRPSTAVRCNIENKQIGLEFVLLQILLLLLLMQMLLLLLLLLLMMMN